MDSITGLLNGCNTLGLTVGICTFLIIGLFHPICIKCEYYFGVRCWWAFLLAGLVMAVLSLIASDTFVSVICGVVAFSSFWTIGELFEQRNRVRKGWFPRNPKRDDDGAISDSDCA